MILNCKWTDQEAFPPRHEQKKIKQVVFVNEIVAGDGSELDEKLT